MDLTGWAQPVGTAGTLERPETQCSETPKRSETLDAG